MEEQRTYAGNLKLLGGRLCLDYANTVDWHAGAQPHEWLTSYEDLLSWSRLVGLLHNDEVARLQQLAKQRPAEQAEVYRRAIELREVLYRIFSAVAAGRAPAEADLDLFNMALQQALVHLRVVPASQGFKWSWSDHEALDRMLWPVARSAAELLTSAELDRVRECEGTDCGWLFLDTSKNRRRRWCAMEDCGNRAKARRHYARTRMRS